MSAGVANCARKPPVARGVLPAPSSSPRSSTTTSRTPRAVRCQAMLAPMTPAPMITTEGMRRGLWPGTFDKRPRLLQTVPSQQNERDPVQHILDTTRYGVSPFAVPTLVTAALIFVFGASVLARRASRVAGAFFAIAASASVWLIAFTFMYCAKDATTALFWARLAYLGVPFLAPSIYHFTAEMLRIAKERGARVSRGDAGRAAVWRVANRGRR